MNNRIRHYHKEAMKHWKLMIAYMALKFIDLLAFALILAQCLLNGMDLFNLVACFCIVGGLFLLARIGFLSHRREYHKFLELIQ